MPVFDHQREKENRGSPCAGGIHAMSMVQDRSGARMHCLQASAQLAAVYVLGTVRSTHRTSYFLVIHTQVERHRRGDGFD